MANNYTLCTANEVIPCSTQDYLELHELLSAHEDNDTYPGFDLEYDEDAHTLYMFTEDGNSSVPDDLSSKFLDKFGEILTKAELQFLEFGLAYTCDKMRVGTHGGTSFRICSTGTLEWAKIVWE
jgi:hypothetical protein